MLRKNVLISVLILVVCLPSMLLAQEMRHGKWWRDKSIIRELGLTASEEKALEEKYIASRRRMIDLKSEIEKQRFELDLLLGAEDASRQEIMERYDSLENARAELSRVRFEMLMDVRQTIGAERFHDLKFLYRDRNRGDRDRRDRDPRDRRKYPGDSPDGGRDRD